LAQRLKQERLDLAAQGVPPAAINQSAKQHKAQLETELAPLWQAAHLAYHNYRHDWDKAERYALKERLLLRQLEDLTAQARQMFQLDDRKDHLMTSLRLALTNLIMWTRDRFFPPSYAHATWHRLAPFFRLPGHIVDQPDHRLVFLRPFNEQALNRDLAALCDQINALKPCLPDGRQLRFLPYQALSLISDMPP
jgi:hypothetical protein